MENQHRKISGYRELTQEEIDLMNEAKALEEKCLALHEKIEKGLERQAHCDEPAEHERQQKAMARRWLAIGRTDIETGFMALVRSVAQPQPR